MIISDGAEPDYGVRLPRGAGPVQPHADAGGGDGDAASDLWRDAAGG